MPEQNQMSWKGMVVGVVVGLVAGFLLGKVTPSSSPAGQNPEVQKLQAQIESAKKFFPSAPKETRNISGTVKEVRGDTMVFESRSFGPFDESPRTRMITLGSATKVVRSEQKDRTTFQAELAEFQKKMRAQVGGSNQGTTLAPIAPPTPFREVQAQLSDIKAGLQVSVTAEENIRDKEAFAATIVSISSFLAVPVAQKAPKK